jgi:uncharacterized membrane protein
MNFFEPHHHHRMGVCSRCIPIHAGYEWIVYQDSDAWFSQLNWTVPALVQHYAGDRFETSSVFFINDHPWQVRVRAKYKHVLHRCSCTVCVRLGGVTASIIMRWRMAPVLDGTVIMLEQHVAPYHTSLRMTVPYTYVAPVNPAQDGECWDHLHQEYTCESAPHLRQRLSRA